MSSSRGCRFADKCLLSHTGPHDPAGTSPSPMVGSRPASSARTPASTRSPASTVSTRSPASIATPPPVVVEQEHAPAPTPARRAASSLRKRLFHAWGAGPPIRSSAEATAAEAAPATAAAVAATPPPEAVLHMGSFEDFLSRELEPLPGLKIVSWAAVFVNSRAERSRLASGSWDMDGAAYSTQPREGVLALWVHFAACARMGAGGYRGRSGTVALAVTLRRLHPTRMRGWGVQSDAWVRCAPAAVRWAHTTDATGEQLVDEGDVEFE